MRLICSLVLLSSSHAHFDHMQGHAAMKRGFLTQMYARFWVVEGPPCSGRGSGCRSWRS